MRASCFRCGCSRKESEAMNTPHVVPPRKPSRQGARKNNGLGNDKGAIARMVLEAFACLDSIRVT